MVITEYEALILISIKIVACLSSLEILFMAFVHFLSYDYNLLMVMLQNRYCKCWTYYTCSDHSRSIFR